MKRVELFKQRQQHVLNEQPCADDQQWQVDQYPDDFRSAGKLEQSTGQYEQHDDGNQVLYEKQADDKFTGVSVCSTVVGSSLMPIIVLLNISRYQ